MKRRNFLKFLIAAPVVASVAMADKIMPPMMPRVVPKSMFNDCPDKINSLSSLVSFKIGDQTVLADGRTVTRVSF